VGCPRKIGQPFTFIEKYPALTVGLLCSQGCITQFPRGGKSGVQKHHSLEPNPFLEQRFIDLDRDDHHSGRNLPKAAQGLAAAPENGEKEKQTTAKTGCVAIEERAGLSIMSGRRGKGKGIKARNTGILATAERKRRPEEESTHSRLFLFEQKLRVLWGPRRTDPCVGRV